MTQLDKDQAIDTQEVRNSVNAGRNLPVKEFCYLRTVNLGDAVCKP